MGLQSRNRIPAQELLDSSKKHEVRILPPRALLGLVPNELLTLSRILSLRLRLWCRSLFDPS